MSLSLTPTKRQHSHNSTELNGKKFVKKSSFDSPKQPGESTSGADVFRVLVSSSKIESIAEQEKITSLIHQETGATVRINSPILGCDERVIFILGPDKKARDKENDTDNTNGNDRGTLSMQRALILVLEKFVEGEKEIDVEETVTFRLLVLSNHIGCLLGRGGSMIKKLSTESGAQIQVLPRDKHPQCASSTDDVVQIIGVGGAVKKAIKSVSQQIMENLNGDHSALPSYSSGPPFSSHNHPVPNIPPILPNLHGNILPSRINAFCTVVFRLLCPDERIGGLIGKGGAIIKIMKHATECDIKILEGFSKGKERIVVVSGPLRPDDTVSAVQDAIRRILDRIAKPIPNGKEKGITAKFLIPSNEVGFINGEGGSIISAIQKNTGAVIRFLGKDQLPKSASGDNEVIQITGDLKAVQEAALQITRKLQQLYLHGAFPFGFSDPVPPFAPFMARPELSPHFGPSFRNVDSAGGPPSQGGLHPPFMHGVNQHEIFGSPWPPQALMEGVPNGFGPHHRNTFGVGGESQHAIFANTSVEVIVPSSLIPSICGEDGGCLRQIRQISDARIVINDPGPGVSETLILISGTPEQTNAAHSLIHAFVMIENETSR